MWGSQLIIINVSSIPTLLSYESPQKPATSAFTGNDSHFILAMLKHFMAIKNAKTRAWMSGWLIGMFVYNAFYRYMKTYIFGGTIDFEVGAQNNLLQGENSLNHFCFYLIINAKGAIYKWKVLNFCRLGWKLFMEWYS